MISASASLSHSPQVGVQPEKNLLSTLLKALIVAIAAAVGAIFGFFLVALAGALVGSLLAGSIAFAATHLFCVHRLNEAVLEESQNTLLAIEIHEPQLIVSMESSVIESAKEELPRLAERVDVLSGLLEAQSDPLAVAESLSEEFFNTSLNPVDLDSSPLEVPELQVEQTSDFIESAIDSAPVQEVQEIQIAPEILSFAGTNSSYFVQMLSLHRGNSQGVTSHKNLSTGIEQLSTIPFTSVTPFRPVTLSEAASGSMGIFPMGELSVLQNPSGIDSLPQPSYFGQPFDPEEELRIAQSLPGHSQFPQEENMPVYLDRLLCAIVRVMSYGEISSAQKANLKKHLNQNLLPILASPNELLEHLNNFNENRRLVSLLNKKIEEPTSFYHDFNESLALSRAMIEFMGELVSTIEPLPLTPEERELFKHPCPLVFASTRTDPVLDLNFLRIGQDLQYVYAAAEDMERVRAVLKNPADGKPYEIEVRDLATLSVI